MLNAIQVLMEHGGFASWLIFAAGLSLIVVGAERLVVLYYRLSFDTTALQESIRTHVLSRQYPEAIQLCNGKLMAPQMQVMKAGLLAVESGREAMKSALGGELLEITHRSEKRVSYLALIANVATLLGLLGTISGLIKTFAAIANAEPAEKARLLGMGISEAMYATAAGLGVGILAMVVHTLCTAKADSIVGAAQDCGLKLITWVEQSERAPK